MRAFTGRISLLGAAAALALPAVATGAVVQSVYQGKKGDFLVSANKRTIDQFYIVCKTAKGGITGEAVNNLKPVKFSKSGSFSLHGKVNYSYSTSKGFKSRVVTVKLSGTVVSKKHVSGKLTGGPDRCNSVSFKLAYNPHPGG